MDTDLMRSEMRELTDLLDVAERIQASYESATRREGLWRLLEGMAFAAASALLLFGILSSGPTLPIAVGTVGIVVYVFFADAVVVQRIRRRSKRDRRALREVLDLVREVGGFAAVDEDWTPLQRAEFKIRLSRFEIEEPRSLLSELLKRVS